MATFSEYKENDMISIVWSNRVMLSICGATTCYILFKELKSRYDIQKTRDESNTDIDSTIISRTSTAKLRKLLNIWSLIGLIASAILPFFYIINKLPFICLYLYRVTAILQKIQHLPIGYFALTRLQYVLSSKSIHSKNFGYSKCTFIILWIWGVINLLMGLTVDIFMTPYERIINDKSYGCGQHNTFLYVLMVSVGGICMWAYDFTILSLYSCKIRQFKRTKVAASLPAHVTKRVTYIMNKVTFLTLSWEVSTILAGLAPVPLFSIFRPGIAYPITLLFTCGANIIFSLSMFLLIERHDDVYIEFVGKYLVGYCHCDVWFCCCCHLLDIEGIDARNITQSQSNDNNEQKEVDENATRDSSTKYETGTLHVKQRHSSVIEVSNTATSAKTVGSSKSVELS